MTFFYRSLPSGYSFVLGSEAVEHLFGGAGYDILSYTRSTAAVHVDLGLGGSSAQADGIGYASGDTISGFEKIIGSRFADTLFGGAEADAFSGGHGADTMTGGGGYDQLDYRKSWWGVRIDLRTDASGLQSASGGHANGDVISGFEKVVGSRFADWLHGDDGANLLRGGIGADTLDGGDGFDTLDYRRSYAGVVVDLFTDHTGRQSASGGDASGDVVSGFEKVIGSDHDDILIGAEGYNVLRGGRGADTLDGGAGFDAVSYAGSDAGVLVDLREDAAGRQWAQGGDAEGDRIARFEQVIGSAHDDTLIGSAGFDILVGRGGADLFVFADPAGWRNADKIRDFDASQDRIGLSIPVFSALAEGALSSEAFAASKKAQPTSAAHRVLYDTDSGNLFYDPDGLGGAKRIIVARLDPSLDLSASNFVGLARINRAPVAGDLTVRLKANEVAVERVPVSDLNLSDTFDFTLEAGLATIDALGSVRIDPAGRADSLNAGQSMTEVLNYTVTDFGGLSDTGTVTIIVEGVNDAPVALDDTAQTDEGAAVVLTPLDNDSDIDTGDSLRIVAVEASDAGSTVIAPDGQSITFIPVENFNGTATLTYTVADAAGAQDTASIVVTVINLNDAPVVRGISGAVVEGAVLLLTPDFSDPDAGDSHSVTVSAASQAQGASVDADGTIRFDAGARRDLGEGQSETVILEYTVEDAAGAKANAQISVTVTGRNDPVIASDDTIAGQEDQVLTLTPLDNDIDPDRDDTLRITDVTSATHGTAEIAADGQSILFTPDADYAGTVEIRYVVTSSDGSTDTATVTVTLAGVNDAPVARDMVIETSQVDWSTGIILEPDFIDPDIGDTYTLSLTYPETNPYGTEIFMFTPDNGRPVIAYQSAIIPAGTVFTESFTYTVTDSGGLSSTATVTATTTDINVAPWIDLPRLPMLENETLTTTYFGANSGNLGEGYRITGIRHDDTLTVTTTPDGQSITITPDTDWNGTANLQLQITDDRGLVSDWSNTQVRVYPVAEAPDVSLATQATARGDQFILTVSGQSNDPLGEEQGIITTMQVTAVDANGNAFANQSDFFDTSEAFLYAADRGSHDFVVTIPDYVSDGFRIIAEVGATEGSQYFTAATTTQTLDVGLSRASHDLSGTIGFNDASLWAPGADTRHEAGTSVRALAFFNEDFYANLFTGGGSYLGVGASAAVSTKFGINGRGDLTVHPKVWVEGGGVDGGVAYDAGVTSLRNDITGQLSFQTEATPDVLQSWFSADSPNAGFDLTLEQLSLFASAYFQLWGYAHVHYTVGSEGPEVDLGLNLPSIGLDVTGLLGGAFDLISYDGNTLSLLNGLYERQGTSFTKTFTSGTPLGNELGQVTITKPLLSTRSTSADSQSVYGGSTADFANFELDLDGIAATIKGIKNPNDWDYRLDAGLLDIYAFFEALDIDLRTDFKYGQSHVLTPGALKGTLVLENGTEVDFIFGDDFTVGLADDFDANGDGQVSYAVRMKPDAQFQTKAQMLVDIYDHLSIVNAGGSVDVGFDVAGLGTGFSIGTGGPLYQTDGVLVDRDFTLPLTTQDFALEIAALQSDTLFA